MTLPTPVFGVYNFGDMLPDPTGVDDCYPLLAELLAVTTTPGTGTGWYPYGCKIYFPPGVYRFSQKIELKKYTVLFGDHSVLSHAKPVVLKFDPGVSGITVNRYNTLNGDTETTPTTGADGSIIRGLLLEGSGEYGIWQRARAVLEDVECVGFVHPFLIKATAGAGGALEGNANRWYMDRTRGALRVDGADANTGLSIAHDAPGGADCGIHDTSFLGNVYIKPHTAANGVGYNFDNDSARHVVLGGYAEGNQGGTIFNAPMMAIGGIYGSFSVGGTIVGRFGNNLEQMQSVEVNDGANRVKLGGGNILEFAHKDDHPAWPWRFKRVGADFHLNHANLGARTAFELLGEKTTEKLGTGIKQPYKIQIKEFGIGSGNNTRLITKADFD